MFNLTNHNPPGAHISHLDGGAFLLVDRRALLLLNCRALLLEHCFVPDLAFLQKYEIFSYHNWLLHIVFSNYSYLLIDCGALWLVDSPALLLVRRRALTLALLKLSREEGYIQLCNLTSRKLSSNP